MIISQTSNRLSILGGGTDLPSWSDKYGGEVVGGAIDKYSLISARFLPPFHDFKTRVCYSTIETVKDNLDIQHRSVKAAIQYLGMEKDGLEIFHSSDLPGRSGIGSSSTFVVGLLNSLASLTSRRMFPQKLAAAAIHIERNMLGETVGSQDQTFAAYGGLNVIKFHKNGDIDTFPLTINADLVWSLEKHLLLFYTRLPRTSSEIASTYAGSLGEREREMWSLVRLTEQGVGAIHNGQFEKLGGLVDQSWRIKARLSGAVTNHQINQLYNAARIYGAWGGKITGSGGGGSLMLVAPPEKQAAIITQLEQMNCVHIPFRFCMNGSQIIFIDRSNHEYRRI